MVNKYIISFSDYIKETVNSNETIEDYIVRYREEAKVKDFLDNSFKNPNFILKFAKDVVKYTPKYFTPEYNKCETNVFNFIKYESRLLTNFGEKERFFPVSGWVIVDTYSIYEHFWIYDVVKDIFLEITPFKNTSVKDDVYGGVVNYNINDKIRKANKVFDIDFLKGKVLDELYSDYI